MNVEFYRMYLDLFKAVPSKKQINKLVQIISIAPINTYPGSDYWGGCQIDNDIEEITCG